MANNEDKDKSITAHLEELRDVILKCVIALLVVLPFIFYFSPAILNYLIKLIIKNNTVSLNYFSPMEVFLLQLKLSFLVLPLIILLLLTS